MTVSPPTPFPASQPLPEQVTFDRKELGAVLRLYGQFVAAGEWRDYGLSFLREAAVFSVFRRSAEAPLYRIEKRPKLRDKQGMYAVVGMDGFILRRGHDLPQVLRVLEQKLIRPVD
ncbi:MAG: DUF2794 domain-containing protein [Cypionkella sp.]